MPYNINRYKLLVDPDLKFPISVKENTIDNTSTSLNLTGNNTNHYGQIINQDMVWLLESFAGPTPPLNPITGQVWYDNSVLSAKVFDGTVWHTMNPSVGLTFPTNPSIGDSFWNQITNQLFYWSGTTWTLVGPSSADPGSYFDFEIINGVQVYRLVLNQSTVALFSSASIPYSALQNNPPPLNDQTNFPQGIDPGINISSIGSLGTNYLVNNTSYVINPRSVNFMSNGTTATVDSNRNLIIDLSASMSSYPQIQEDNVIVVNNAQVMNFTGNGISVTGSGMTATLDIPSITISQNGISVLQGATDINFLGTSITTTGNTANVSVLPLTTSENGTSVLQGTYDLNFTGATVTATGSTANINIPTLTTSLSGSSVLTDTNNLNFTGVSITASGNTANIDVPVLTVSEDGTSILIGANDLNFTGNCSVTSTGSTAEINVPALIVSQNGTVVNSNTTILNFTGATVSAIGDTSTVSISSSSAISASLNGSPVVASITGINFLGSDILMSASGTVVNVSTLSSRVYLTYSSATTVKMIPTNGNQLTNLVSGPQIIPSSGVIGTSTNCYINGVAGQSLLANTLYYIYEFSNSGTPTLDFSTTVWTNDSTTGWPIKTGDSSRTLVGLCRTNSSVQFSVGSVISYWNRQGLPVSQGLSGNTVSGSPTPSGLLINFVSWGGSTISFDSGGSVYNSTANSGTQIRAYIDGVGVSYANYFYSPMVNQAGPVSTGGFNTVTEGYHTIEIYVNTYNGGEGFFNLGLNMIVQG